MSLRGRWATAWLFISSVIAEFHSSRIAPMGSAIPAWLRKLAPWGLATVGWTMIQLGEFAVAELLFTLSAVSFGIQIYEWSGFPGHRQTTVALKTTLGLAIFAGYSFWAIVTVKIMGERPLSNLLTKTAIDHRNPPEPPRPQSDLSNAQVKDMALDLIRSLRLFQQQLSDDHRKLEEEHENKRDSGGNTEALHEWYLAEDDRLTTRHRIEFGPLLSEVLNIRTQLLNRVPAPQPQPSQYVNLIMTTGILAGPNPVADVADYIEQLAMLLPIQR